MRELSQAIAYISENAEVYVREILNAEIPEILHLRMVNTYMDIYNDYIEMYRDYGSIYTRAIDMRETEPGDSLEYMQKLLLFQELINGYLPIIPIYSNVYFDFYISTLEDYTISRNITWGNAILGSGIGAGEEPETDAGEAADGEVSEMEAESEPEGTTSDADEGLIEISD